MQSDNYILIQGWMCSELNLKGNALLIFALIHGFSQDGQSRFYGSRNYIADTLNISLPTVDKAIEELRDKNLITRYVITDENGVHYEYDVCKETLQGVVKKLYMGGKETLHNNTNKKTTSKKSNSKELLQKLQNFEFGKQKPQKENLYTKCLSTIKTFTQDEVLRDYLKTFLDLRLEMARTENKSFYFGMWTHLLNELKQLTIKDGKLDVELAQKIVNMSTARGWKHFYELTSNDYVKNTNILSESGSRHVPRMTEEDYKKEAEHLAELEARGERVRF